MSVAPLEILACAEVCAATLPLNEAIVRTSVSRAYYSAYHDSLAWEASALALPGKPGSGGMHAQLAGRLTTPNATLPQAIRTLSKQRGYVLRSFHTLRVAADYHLHQDLDEADALQAIADAHRVFLMR